MEARLLGTVEWGRCRNEAGTTRTYKAPELGDRGRLLKISFYFQTPGSQIPEDAYCEW